MSNDLKLKLAHRKSLLQHQQKRLEQAQQERDSAIARVYDITKTIVRTEMEMRELERQLKEPR